MSECQRCNGTGDEDISLSATILGRSVEIDGVLSKTCEHCHGSGTIETTRELRLDELTDAQIKMLLEADIFRETGGRDEEDIQQMQNQHTGMQSGYSRSPSHASTRGGSIPSNPNSF